MAIVPWVYNNPRFDHCKSNVDFIFVGKRITISQNFDKNICIEKNTAFKLWDGAFLLAKHIENPDIFPKNYWSLKKCVELGAGCGLVGIVAWMLGAQVTLTDLPEALVHTEMCLNSVKKQLTEQDGWIDADLERITLQEYTWGDQVPEILNDIDYIFCSDIIYQPSSIDKLIDSILKIKMDKTRVLISYKPRNLGEAAFFEKLSSMHLDFKIVPSYMHCKEFNNSLYQIIIL